MSYMGSPNTFSLTFIRKFTATLEVDAAGISTIVNRKTTDHLKRRAWAIEEALKGINRSDDEIRLRVQHMRSALDSVTEALEAVNHIHEQNFGGMSWDLGSALLGRKQHYEILNALLTEEEQVQVRAEALRVRDSYRTAETARLTSGHWNPGDGLHDHDGYPSHSHEIRADHQGLRKHA